jgi:diguanylate cyclase (GGDEF)-like protein
MTEWKATLVDSRYTIVEKLAESAYFGDLFHTIDKETGEPVRLVRLSSHVVSFIGHGQMKLRATLFQQDPSLPMMRILDVFSGVEGVSVVYEWEEGCLPLLGYVQGKSLPEIIGVLKNLCDALSVLHGKTLWHGGIVPEHVFVLPDGEIRLLTMLSDSPFGLFNAAGRVDALQFFAPETLSMNPYDARTDIYNLGVLFYLVLTGRYPFSGDEQSVDPPSRYNPHIPPQIDRMVLKMMNARPSKRFQWIGQIIDELSRMLGRHNSNKNAAARHYGSQLLFSAEFTGRAEESARLALFYERLIKGQAGTLLISGNPGIGRKRLIYEVSGNYLHGFSGVSASVTSDRSGATIEDMTARMLMVCFGVPKLEKIGKDYVKRISKFVPQVAYDYREMVESDRREYREERDMEALLIEFFTKIVEETDQPYIIELYDAHMLDAESVQFFKKLLNQGLLLSIVATAEEETPALSELFEETMRLPHLKQEQLRDCLISRFGDADFLSEDFMQWLIHHAQGALDRMFSLVEYLADTNQIYLERYVWHMVPQSVEKLNIPESMEMVILHRMKQIPRKAQDVYEVMSLFKGAFLYEAIAKTVDLGAVRELVQMMRYLEENGLLIEQSHNFYRFPSNNLKTHVYESIPQQTRKDLHRKLAFALLDFQSTDLQEIAHHFEQAEEWTHAIYLYAYGARMSHKNNQLVTAVAQIRKAIELYRHLPEYVCPNSFHMFHAKLLKLSGSLEEASVVYGELYERTKSLRVLASLTMNYVNLGHFHLVKPYVPYMRELIDSDKPSLKQKLNMMVIVGMYYIENEAHYDYIKELEDYHQKNGHLLRESVRNRDYINWLYNLQVLLIYVPGVPWEQRSRYLHEAATLAEHHNYQQLLIGIYNSMAIGFQETDPLKAKDNYLQSARLAAELGDKSKETIAYINLIAIYMMLGDMYHSHRYIEKARETGTEVNRQDDSYLLQNEIEHFMFIEDYDKAMEVLRKLERTARLTQHHKMREYAFLYLFAIYAEQGDIRRADRLWPLVERICESRKLTTEHQFMRARYLLLNKRYPELIDEMMVLISDNSVPTEARIRRYFYLIEAMLQVGRWNEGLDYAQAVQKLIHNTGYVGFLARAHLYLGRLYQLTHQFVQANLNYKRAMMWYRKLNQQTRLAETDRLMRQTNQEMIEAADRITDTMIEEVQGDGETVAHKISEGGNSLKDWAKTIVKERQEMIDTLTDNEILLDAIRRVSSSIMVKTVCENLASVVFENLLFDYIHLYIKIGDSRVETIHLNEQLQEIPNPTLEVDNLIANVIQARRQLELEGHGVGSYLYGIPVFSHDQQVISVMVLEKISLQTPFTVRDKRFIQNFAQLVASNVENAILYEVMITDNLTGLYQRNYFMKRLDEEFAKIKRYGIDLSYLMIDLDNFSRVNNLYGHHEGDRVLRVVAQTILKSVRNVDIVGRFGGEEIIVILPNTNGAAARIVAERILNNLRKIPVEGNRYQITASIGVASNDMDQPSDALVLTEKADHAETYAKRNGKNRVVCYWELSDEVKQQIIAQPDSK